jgi:hypothetical protein
MADYNTIKTQFNITLPKSFFKNGFEYIRDNDYEQILNELEVENINNPYSIFDVIDNSVIDLRDILDNLTESNKTDYDSNPTNFVMNFKNDALTINSKLKLYFKDKIKTIATPLVNHLRSEPSFTKFKINDEIMNASLRYNSESVTNIHSIPLYMVVLCGGRKRSIHITLVLILNKKIYTIGFVGNANILSPDTIMSLKPGKMNKILDIGIFKHEYALNLNTIISKYMKLEVMISTNPEYADIMPLITLSLEYPINIKKNRFGMHYKPIYEYSKHYTGYLFSNFTKKYTDNQYIQFLNCAKFVVDVLTTKSKLSFLSSEHRLRCNFSDSYAFEPADPFRCDTIPPFDERAPYIYILIHALRVSVGSSRTLIKDLIKLLDLKDSVYYMDEVLPV